jgi:hypothetical protein
MSHRPAPLLIALVLLAAAHASVCAQSAHRRLSSLEGTTRTLPEELRIQGADTSSGRYFIAWGTYVAGDVGEGVRSLMLSVGGIGSIDTATVSVHDRSARPSRLVRVVAGPDGTASVLWYDRRRDAPGLYARVFAPSGEATESVRRIATGLVADFISEPHAPELTPVALGEGTLLLLGAAGRIRTAPAFPRAMLSPHALMPDSSLLSLVGSELQLRRHFTDASPVWTRAIAPPGGSFSDAWTIGIDDGGSPALYYFESDEESPPTCFGEYWAGVKLRRVPVGADGSLGPSVVIDTFYTCNSAFTGVGAKVRSIERRRAGGGHAVTITFARERRTTTGDIATTLDTVSIGIGPRGEYVRRMPRSGEWNGGRIGVVRASADSVSRVVAHIDDREVVIDAAIADAPAGISQTAPAIPEKLPQLLAWREAVGTRTRFVLSRLDGLDAVPIDTVEGKDEIAHRRSTPSSIQSEHVTRWVRGAVPIAMMYGWEWAYTTATSLGLTTSTAAAFIPGPSGWRSLLGWSHSMIRSAPGGEYQPVAHGSGFDGSAAVALDDRTWRHVIRFDGRSNARDSARASDRGALTDVLPLDRSHWALVDGDTMRVADPDVVGAPIPLPPADAREPVWEKLDDGRLLRAVVSSDERTLRLVELDALGVIRGRAEAVLPEGARGLALVSSTEGALIALIETPRGIEAIMLSRSLVVTGSALAVGDLHDSIAHVTGGVRNGELVVAWEEIREGTSDVFGAQIPLGTLGVSERRERSTSDIMRLQTRRDEQWLETIESDDWIDSTFHLIGARGERVISQAGERLGERWRARFAIDALPSGVYLVVASSSDGRMSSAIVTILR